VSALRVAFGRVRCELQKLLSRALSVASGVMCTRRERRLAPPGRALRAAVGRAGEEPHVTAL